MKKLIFFFTCVALLGQLSAQNPFKELGIKDSDYLTLSDGRYDEFHGYNDYERVGSAIIDMRTNKIARFIDRDSVIDEGMAELDMTTRFLTIDPMAEKYSQMSPYAYCANNPILFIDPNGKEISFSYEYEKDKDGKYVVNKNGGYNLTGVTMNVTGKVINVSGKDVDMNAATEGISSMLESSFSGEIDGVSFKTNSNLTVANTMDDVSESDHVFAIADISKIDGKTVTGGANDFGGKVAFLNSDYFSGAWDKNIGNTGERTAGHEFGHLSNLRHGGGYFNIMEQGAGNSWFSMSTDVANAQLKKIHTAFGLGLLNQGSNSEMLPIYNYSAGNTSFKKMPNRGKVKSLINY